jgi:lysophospholipase L1-like esterase
VETSNQQPATSNQEPGTSKQQLARARPQLTIVALGDSTTAGTPGFRSPVEAPPDGAGNVESQFAYWLEHRHPEWRILNRGVNGQRSDEIRLRFDHDVVAANPSAVIIIAGVNDVYQGRPAAWVQEQLAAMYATAHTHDIPVVAGTIIPYNTATAEQNTSMRVVNDWISRYVHSNPDVTFCDTRAAVALPTNSDRLASSPDDLHPSPDGYRLMALALEPAIRRALTKRRGLR